jgi:hypothetical protein
MDHLADAVLRGSISELLSRLIDDTAGERPGRRPPAAKESLS